MARAQIEPGGQIVKLLSSAVETRFFDYDLPEAAIAQHPVEPRDSARLLRTSSLEDLQFSDLPTLLGPHDLLVVNRTRVRAARLRGHRADTGGTVELLLLRRLDEARWSALVKPARRIRKGRVLMCGPVTAEVLTDPDRGEVTVCLESPGADIEDVLATVGEVPLPPYIKAPLNDPERYQTVFAKTLGSAAAPTAALHFTPRLIAHLLDAGVSIAEVDLEVGLDTFRPIATESVEEHQMHRESWRVPSAAEEAVKGTRRRGGRVIAVGTTVVRTLESAASGAGLIRAGSGDTDLFIGPGYRMKVVDAVITNFHAPRTTLIVMIAAMLGPRWNDVYQYAIDAGYRFLSFGDSMFIEEMVAAR